ncbi:Hypothetical predicted protein [Pelobates cultripes]|uniref:Uncharacterized protein n=1 Tax=Pelobates cultripes TaxID=61616 RepID=A0AAD1RR15_PELCU|nr:Hypothetical predicted protein [Pelobates cultripes]
MKFKKNSAAPNDQTPTKSSRTYASWHSNGTPTLGDSLQAPGSVKGMEQQLAARKGAQQAKPALARTAGIISPHSTLCHTGVQVTPGLSCSTCQPAPQQPQHRQTTGQQREQAESTEGMN